MKKIRKPAVAGMFYPNSKDRIKEMIDSFRNEQQDKIKELLEATKEKEVSGIIVPHAGWPYSGKTATLGFEILGQKHPAKIAILAPSHFFPIAKVYRDEAEAWNTPLGNLSLVQDEYFPANQRAHLEEHSIEVQVPLVQYYAPNSEVLPLAVGDLEPHHVEDIAKHLYQEGYFLIISTDLSHFFPLEKAKEIDKRSIKAIENLNPKEIDACGLSPLRVSFEYCSIKKTTPVFIDYSTSAELTEDIDKVVGYSSFYF